jgi:mannose-6-phosphate isomerase-like protein (cupin superfamily)
MSVANPVNTPAFSVVHAGAYSTWQEHQLDHPKLGTIPKEFLQGPLGSRGMEMSVNYLPPGYAMPFTHAHQNNEELYIWLAGEGEFYLDGQLVPVQTGSIVRVATATARAWRNPGSEPAAMVCIQYPELGQVAGTTSDGRLVEASVAWDTATRMSQEI